MKKLMLIGISVATVYGAFGTSGATRSTSPSKGDFSKIQHVLNGMISNCSIPIRAGCRDELAQKLASNPQAKRDLIAAMGYGEALEAAQALLINFRQWADYTNVANVQANLRSVHKLLEHMAIGEGCKSKDIAYHYTDANNTNHKVVYDHEQKRFP